MARQRRDRFDYGYFHYTPSPPKEVADGVKVRSQRGQIGRTWWGRRWIAALECLLDPGRLRRGRSYARRGQVIDLRQTGLGIEARVQGTRRQPYKVRIALAPIAEADWQRVIDRLAAQAAYGARLLVGEMPDDIDTAFVAAGVSLFPGDRAELVTDCSCPDWANPCKHVAAVHYILGERFDEDPFLLFRLRGRDRDALLDDLRRRRKADEESLESSDGEEGEESEAPAPLEATVQRFWEVGAALDGFAVHIAEASAKAPILQRLGQPAFTDILLQPVLRPVLASAARRAIEHAFA